LPSTLTLRAVSLNDRPITQPIAASFGVDGGSIGRADSNTLSLPDPERRISRRQAEVVLSGTGFMIRNVGSANPIIVRDESLALGESARLDHGDQVRIGGYLLEVTRSDQRVDERTELDSGAAVGSDPFAVHPSPASPKQVVAAHPVPAAVAFPASSPFADLGPAASLGNPFADLLGGSPPAPSTGAGVSGASSRLPDDFDPFAPPPASVAPAPKQSVAGGGAFDDLVPTAERGSIDTLFGLTPSSGSSDPLATFMVGASAAADAAAKGAEGAANVASTDPLAMFANAREPIVPSAPSIADRTPELRAGFMPPKPVPQAARVPPPIATPPAAAVAAAKVEPHPASPLAARAAAAQSAAQAATAPRPPAAAARDDESTNPPATGGWSEESLAVWHYLCEGAGVRLDPPPNTGPAFMRVVGMILRSAVEGTVQQMAVRQATRQELQAQVTVIRPKNNNPLKFAPDGQSAMEQMLQPAVRGFLPGPAAMTDAMHDLLGHAIGTMAGTRAALEGVLKRFGPQELEAKLASKSVLDSVLPMNRKAKLWELYLQHYGSIRDEAQEDFHTLFGRAFLAAYEQQLERLRREKAASAAPK
jgi:FHA domain-containing protein